MKKFILNFENLSAAQDMLTSLKKETSKNPEDIIVSAINKKIAKRIIDTKWASIALHLWGHGSYDGSPLGDDGFAGLHKLIENPVYTITLSDLQYQLLSCVMEEEEVDIETAVTYFLMFTLETFGYHL